MQLDEPFWGNNPEGGRCRCCVVCPHHPDKLPDEHSLEWIYRYTVFLAGVQKADNVGAKVDMGREPMRLADVYWDYDVVQ